MTKVLIDLSPMGAAHGARGIGAYVRGLVAAICELAPAERSEIAGLCSSPCQISTSIRRVTLPAAFGWRLQDLGWLSGRLVVQRLVRRTRAEAFHATDPFRPWLPSGVPSAVTAYDLIPYRDPEVLMRWRHHRRLIYRGYLKALRSAARVIAISQATADDLVNLLQIRRDTVDVVYPVVRRRTIERRPSAEPTFLVVGAGDPHKQPELAVAAIAAFYRRHRVGALEFIGPMTGRQAASIVELARARGVADRVSVRGPVSEAALSESLGRATALLSVSRIEGFGLPPVEAVLAGTPAIAVDTPVARETLGHAATLVSPDPDELASAMEAPQLASADERAKLGARYGASAVGGMLSASYGRLLGRN